MCFSASASFGAGALILITGIVSVKKATTPAQYVLAGVPLFFAIQQFLEGILWLALTNAEYANLQNMGMYGFLVFAQVIWPGMVPYTVMLLEPDTKRKKLLKAFVALGLALSIYLACCLLVYDVQASVAGHHIKYELFFPQKMSVVNNIVYFIPTIIPPVISGIKKMRLLGLAILLSYIVSRIFFPDYVISVWCYFAAIISVIAMFIIIDLNKNKTQQA